MLGFSALAARAFNSLIQKVVNPTPTPTWGSKGGIGKKRKEHIKKSARAEMQEHLEALFAEPVAQELKEEVKEYVKPSQGFSVHSIDYGKLARDIELVQRIMQKAQEIRDEQEDEAVLLMLM
jgi:5'-deoxynucleotidase YfbR-like HD superfamily hydrolase